uniref:HPt domain-containing protein n=1 Tax=Prymnesium polylepis TaxID=72548 RepID=A0A7S4M880_9EUKA
MKLVDLPAVQDVEEKHDALTFAKPACPRTFVFDFSKVVEQHSLHDDLGFALEMVEQLVEEYNNNSISNIACQEYVDIWKRAHAFKGASANLGLSDMAATSWSVETIAGALAALHKKLPTPEMNFNEDMQFLTEQYNEETLNEQLEMYVTCLNRRAHAVEHWYLEHGKPFGQTCTEGGA